MANSIGDLYPTQIPELTDEANIRTALNLYHYGADSEAGVQPQSIAGYLGALESGKVATAPTVIATGTDLNTVDETGFYYIPNVSGITNYPGSTAYQGFLTVIKYSNDVISQQYQIIGATESSGGPASQLNKTYRRFKYSGSWKVWRTYISSDELTSIGDLRYYTQTIADATFLTQADAADLYLTQVAAAESLLVQEVAVASTEYTLQLTDSSKVLNVSAASDATITVPLNSVAAFDIGTIINIYSTSDSAVNVVGETSQVIIRPFSNNQFRLYGKYTEISLRKRATNEWVAAGNIVEISE